MDAGLWRVVHQRRIADDPALHDVLGANALARIIDADVDDVVLVIKPEIEPRRQHNSLLDRLSAGDALALVDLFPDLAQGRILLETCQPLAVFSHDLVVPLLLLLQRAQRLVSLQLELGFDPR